MMSSELDADQPIENKLIYTSHFLNKKKKNEKN